MYLLVAMMLSGCNNWTRQLVSLRLVSAKHVDSAKCANKHEGILVCHTLFYPDCALNICSSVYYVTLPLNKICYLLITIDFTIIGSISNELGVR